MLCCLQLDAKIAQMNTLHRTGFILSKRIVEIGLKQDRQIKKKLFEK